LVNSSVGKSSIYLQFIIPSDTGNFQKEPPVTPRKWDVHCTVFAGEMGVMCGRGRQRRKYRENESLAYSGPLLCLFVFASHKLQVTSHGAADARD